MTSDAVYFVHRGGSVNGTVVNADALEFLAAKRSESADIVFLDPPFNLGKDYGDKKKVSDRLARTVYEEWLGSILRQSIRILAPGGTLYFYHIPEWALRVGHLLNAALDFKHWIAVSMKNGFVRREGLYPAHYALLMYTKGAPAVLRRPKIAPQHCRHCGELLKDYGGYKDIIMNSGINLSDFWDDLSPVRHGNTKNRLQNELPALLFKRIIEISGKSGGLYIDPFCGTGSGVLAAVAGGMRFGACDILEWNCQIVNFRLSNS